MENSDLSPSGILNFFAHLGQAKVKSFCFLKSILLNVLKLNFIKENI